MLLDQIVIATFLGFRLTINCLCQISMCAWCLLPTTSVLRVITWPLWPQQWKPATLKQNCSLAWNCWEPLKRSKFFCTLEMCRNNEWLFFFSNHTIRLPFCILHLNKECAVLFQKTYNAYVKKLEEIFIQSVNYKI